MLVYSGSCQLNSDTSSLATADYVVLSDNLGSQFDLSTEAMHAVELCKLRRWRDHDPDFITKVSMLACMSNNLAAGLTEINKSFGTSLRPKMQRG